MIEQRAQSHCNYFLCVDASCVLLVRNKTDQRSDSDHGANPGKYH